MFRNLVPLLCAQSPLVTSETGAEARGYLSTLLPSLHSPIPSGSQQFHTRMPPSTRPSHLEHSVLVQGHPTHLGHVGGTELTEATQIWTSFLQHSGHQQPLQVQPGTKQSLVREGTTCTSPLLLFHCWGLSWSGLGAGTAELCRQLVLGSWDPVTPSDGTTWGLGMQPLVSLSHSHTQQSPLNHFLLHTSSSPL